MADKRGLSNAGLIILGLLTLLAFVAFYLGQDNAREKAFEAWIGHAARWVANSPFAILVIVGVLVALGWRFLIGKP